MGRQAAPIGTRRLDPKGYWRIRLDHPLAVRGWVREHRLVLFEAIGPGSHRCHYCGREVEWGINLHVDHRDRDRQHNALENLVACCIGCNNGNQGKRVRGRERDRQRRDTGKHRLRCVVDGRLFWADKSNAKTCSARCRKALSRANRPA